MLGRGTISQFAINDIIESEEGGGGGGQDPDAVEFLVRDRSGHTLAVLDGPEAVDEGADVTRYLVRDRSGHRFSIINPFDDDEDLLT